MPSPSPDLPGRRRRREEPRDEVVARRRGAARDDHPAHRQRGQRRVVRRQAPDGVLRVHLDQVVELVSADVLRRHAERLGEAGRRRGRLVPLGWEIELDPLAGAIASEEAALGVEPRLPRGWQVPLLPQHVSARQGRMAAEGDLDRRREPAEVEAIGLPHEKRRLGEVHLAGDALHPACVARRGQEADRRRVARERRVGERIDLRDPEPHGPEV